MATLTDHTVQYNQQPATAPKPFTKQVIRHESDTHRLNHLNIYNQTQAGTDILYKVIYYCHEAFGSINIYIVSSDNTVMYYFGTFHDLKRQPQNINLDLDTNTGVLLLNKWFGNMDKNNEESNASNGRLDVLIVQSMLFFDGKDGADYITIPFSKMTNVDYGSKQFSIIKDVKFDEPADDPQKLISLDKSSGSGESSGSFTPPQIDQPDMFNEPIIETETETDIKIEPEYPLHSKPYHLSVPISQTIPGICNQLINNKYHSLISGLTFTLMLIQTVSIACLWILDHNIDSYASSLNITKSDIRMETSFGCPIVLLSISMILITLLIVLIKKKD